MITSCDRSPEDKTLSCQDMYYSAITRLGPSLKGVGHVTDQRKPEEQKQYIPMDVCSS